MCGSALRQSQTNRKNASRVSHPSSRCSSRLRRRLRKLSAPAGGVVFGYRNVPVLGENDRRSHVVREVRDDEAATVRRIFEMATAGVGLKTIAMALHADGVRSPRAHEGRQRSWAPSSIRTVLFDVLYKGDVLWGAPRSGTPGAVASSAGVRPVSGWSRSSTASAS